MDFTVEDIASVVRLVREASDLWDDPHAWRESLLLGACELLQGNVGTMYAVESCGNRHRVRAIAVVELSNAATAFVHSSIHSSTGSDTAREIVETEFREVPEINQLCEVYEEVGCATMTRSQLTRDAALLTSPMYTEFRKDHDCGDYLVSLRKVDVPQRAGLIQINRPHGLAPFTPREVALLELLHSEIAPLIGVRLTTEEYLSRDGLSRRLNETLSLLLEGCSEKEAAVSLKISPRTLHDYVTMLYKHFKVTSRAELLAYFIHRRPERRLDGPVRRTSK
ncbi:helix-turn-helix transcriptional regulator [Adhaeretor mobilis]|uniref:Bacterial regulatory protein, luxR family n=1 Tax=Adhaeretor mobilis TaxID=1930276 RepID=A0A517MZC6_9BACT|nr:helix-turn-helix transcriptional regulator [Adhaeretor mobilis]QDT00227.1 Bacterial regulatory protein, luxR family [Adhaeretor mobilis]